MSGSAGAAAAAAVIHSHSSTATGPHVSPDPMIILWVWGPFFIGIIIYAIYEAVNGWWKRHKEKTDRGLSP